MQMPMLLVLRLQLQLLLPSNWVTKFDRRSTDEESPAYPQYAGANFTEK